MAAMKRMCSSQQVFPDINGAHSDTYSAKFVCFDSVKGCQEFVSVHLDIASIYAFFSILPLLPPPHTQLYHTIVALTVVKDTLLNVEW